MGRKIHTDLFLKSLIRSPTYALIGLLIINELTGNQLVHHHLFMYLNKLYMHPAHTHTHTDTQLLHECM